jgi:threonine dehydratase
VALEIAREAPDISTLIVPVGGGGLLGGMAGFIKERAPNVRVIGAQSDNTAAMAKSFRAGQIVEIENLPTLADGLAGQVDQAALDIGIAALDDIVTVPESDLARAMLWLLDNHQVKVEGSGAAGVAAVLSGRFSPKGKTAIVVTGGNVDDDRLQQLRWSGVK